MRHGSACVCATPYTKFIFGHCLLDAVMAHQVVQGGPAHAQQFGRAGDIAVGPRQRPHHDAGLRIGPPPSAFVRWPADGAVLEWLPAS